MRGSEWFSTSSGCSRSSPQWSPTTCTRSIARPRYALSRAGVRPRRRAAPPRAHRRAVWPRTGSTRPVIGVAFDGTRLRPRRQRLGRRVPASPISRVRARRSPRPRAAARRRGRGPRAVAPGRGLPVGAGDGRAARGLDLDFTRRSTGRHARMLTAAIEAGLNAPPTSSAGRLFDAVASLLGVRDTRRVTRAQAAVELEALAAAERRPPYPFALEVERDQFVVRTTRPIVARGRGPARRRAVRPDRRRAFTRPWPRSSRDGCAAHRAAGPTCARSALSGGCSRTASCCTRPLDRLERDGFEVSAPHACPPDDGGLALGQAAVAAARELRSARRRLHVPRRSPARSSRSARTHGLRWARSTSAASSAKRLPGVHARTPRSATTCWSTSASPSPRSIARRPSAPTRCSRSSANSASSNDAARRRPMKYLDEYRDRGVAARWPGGSPRAVTRPWVLMEVCGGQTHSIVRYGIDRTAAAGGRAGARPRLPGVRHPAGDDRPRARHRGAARTSSSCSFGDMLRVPGSHGDLLALQSRGADVRVVYSPLDAVTHRAREPRPARWCSSPSASRPPRPPTRWP